MPVEKAKSLKELQILRVYLWGYNTLLDVEVMRSHRCGHFTEREVRKIMDKPMSFTITPPLLGQSTVCEPILRALPDWFGVEEATRQYVRDIDVLPTLLALHEDQVLGFLTLKQHYPWAAELYVMGIFPQAHRQGIGRALVAQAEMVLRAQGVEFFQVKTLAPTHPDPGYARTRAFYEAQGFRSLEIFPAFWDLENPCLLMVKYLGAASHSPLKPDFAAGRPSLWHD